ncbi:MAG: hypothetical protein NT005_07735 [Spirochaetes bacterium]|nr:hypothetical protein [Spirochaetota bacterium]
MNGPLRGARCILVSCFDPTDPQFAGMRKALRTLKGAESAEGAERIDPRDWDGRLLSLARRARLSTLILCGHGREDEAGLGDGRGRFLRPADVRLPGRTRLLLLGCYQGREDLRRAWARGTGLEQDRVSGAEGETETLLSTLFILHLAREGEGRAGELFEEWALANRIVRPFFEQARDLYRSTGGDPLAVLSFLEGVADLGPSRRFLALAGASVEYLAGLVPPQ